MTRRDLGYVSAYTSTVSYVSVLPTFTCDYVLVGGGGGSPNGSGISGGGGGGGVRSTVTATGGGGSLETALTLNTSTNYGIIVGAGGTRFTSGSSSIFSGSSGILEAKGGGVGGYNANDGDGISGGSGGGGGLVSSFVGS